MPGIDSLLAGVISMTGKFYGNQGPFEIRRPHDLTDGSSDALASLELASAANLGATTLSLRRVGGTGVLTGYLPGSIVLTAGAVSLTVDADTGIADGALLSVTLSTPLAAALTQGQVVAIPDYASYAPTSPGGLTGRGAVRQAAQASTLINELSGRMDFELLVPASSMPDGWGARLGDTVLDTGAGIGGTVLSFFPPVGGVWALLIGIKSYPLLSGA